MSQDAFGNYIVDLREPAVAPAESPAISSPFAYYKLDEFINTDMAKDEIGGLAWPGDFVELITGKIGQGFRLALPIDGGGTLNVTDDAFDLSGSSWTIRMWVKALAVDASFHDIFLRAHLNAGFDLYQDSDGVLKVDFLHGTTTTVNIGTLTPDTWQRVVFGYNADDQVFFTKLDNAATVTAASASNISSVSRFMELLATEVLQDFDEIGFWNVALTEDELTADWNSGAGITLP